MSAGPGVLAALCRRTWLQSLRRPVVFTFSLGQPLAWMLFFGFLFERYRLLDLPTQVSYLDFLAPGVCAMTVLFGASQAGVGWIRDLDRGFLPRMLSTPAGRGWILGGKVAADGLRLLAQVAVVALVAVALGARLTASAALLPAAVALALFAVGYSCLSSAVALRARSQEGMAAFVHLVNMPLLFTSTALVPARQMPGWLAAIAAWNPLSLATDGWRQALLFGDAGPALAALPPLALLAAALFLVARAQMRGIAELY